MDKRTKELIEIVISIIKKFLRRDTNFRLYLFGSRATGNNRKFSDIDLAVESSAMNNEWFKKIKQNILEIRTLYKIDLVNLNTVSSEFKNIVLSEANTLYEQ
ncbi:MAG: nucleotidyltransferase domain-containing protein [Candidatus Cloacimonadota bacterium]|nr:nucleotidyltransferase domain-containing protein [Candidatus Cloacimonadota bacterium]